MICPICESEADSFRSFGVPSRPNAQCPHCDSMERHRLLWLYLTEKTDFFKKGNRVLDIAPVKFLSNRWEEFFGDDYISIDLNSPHAKIHMDVTDLQFSNNYFDWIICFHVLEHVIDDRKAMEEFWRVLKPGGHAILQVPLYPGLTYEDPAIVTPEERARAFGQNDHVRKYGTDYFDRLQQAQFNVTIDNYVKLLDPALIRSYGLPEHEDIYLCTK